MTSKRVIEGRIEELEDGKHYPEVSLAQLLSADRLEPVDEERGLVRVDGRIMKDTVTPILSDRFNDKRHIKRRLERLESKSESRLMPEKYWRREICEDNPNLPEWEEWFQGESMTGKQSIENRIGRLEEEEPTLEDLPKILMQNLREEYGYSR